MLIRFFNGEVELPFKEAIGEDVRSARILIHVNQEEPSWWVWFTDEMAPSNVEEWSGIDDKYVVVSEELVVDGVANFMARCIMSNPKAQKLAPEDLQKSCHPHSSMSSRNQQSCSQGSLKMAIHLKCFGFRE